MSRRFIGLAGLSLALATVVGVACAQERPQSLRTEPLEIATKAGPQRFTVEVADHDAQREIGLMYRHEMAADHGMLFEFNAPQRLSFWMKNTYIPLDIVFIGTDGHVLNIARQTTPLSEAAIVSAGPAAAALELRGGRAAEIGLEPGDVIHAKFFHN